MLRFHFIAALLLTLPAFGAEPASKPAAVSKPAEKDGISISILSDKNKLKSDEQPAFIVRLTNTSKDYINLYDVEAYGDWTMIFSKPGDAGARWGVKFDKIHQGDGIAHKQLKAGESLDVAVDLNDPLFTFVYEFVGPVDGALRRNRRHLEAGDYRLDLTISLQNSFGPGYHLWTGPLQTEAIALTIANESRFPKPTEMEISAYDKAMQPTIELTKEKHGLWLNGSFPDIKLADGADADEVIAAAVNRNRSNIGSKAYRVLRIHELDGQADKKSAALISVGKSTKVLIFYSLGGGKWWTRFYAADLQLEKPEVKVSLAVPERERHIATSPLHVIIENISDKP